MTTLRSIDRRRILAGMALAAAASDRALAQSSLPREPKAWLEYESRLRARLQDAAGGVFQRELARELLALTNRERTGVRPLAWSDELALVARAHAADLAARGRIAHLDPKGFDATHRLNLLARRFVGSASENVAARSGPPPSAAEVIDLWRRSPSHWENLRRSTQVAAGFGAVRVKDDTVVVALLSRTNNLLAEPLPLLTESEDQLLRTLSGPRWSPIYRLADPATERLLRGPWTSREQPGRYLPGVYQVRPISSSGSLAGPIFVAPGSRRSVTA